MAGAMTGWSTLKKVLVICAKNALLGILTSTAITHQWHDIFNFDNMPGVFAVLKMCGWAIAIKEGLAWAPWILRWASKNNTPDDVFKDDPLGQAQQDVHNIKAQAAHAESKIEEAKDSQAQVKKEDS